MHTVKTIALMALGLSMSACSANSDGGSPYGGGGNSGGTGGSGGTQDEGGTIVPESGPLGDALPVNPEAATDVVKPDGDTCLAQSAEAEPFPLDMYVMMDQSGSMSSPASLMQPLGPTQWDAVEQAFVDFLGGSPPSGMSMGIQYFPLPITPMTSLPSCPSGSECASDAICVGAGSGNICLDNCSGAGDCSADSECLSADDGNGGTVHFCSNDSCSVDAYATPEVPIGEIPGVNAAIIQSLGAHGPLTMTPSAPALQGAVQYARGWATQHPGHTTIVVFATDGMPSACAGDAIFPINEVKSIAADGVNGSPSIKTFVIGIAAAGMPNSAGNLNAIAASGGTGQAFIVQANQDMSAQFKAALEAIRGAFMQCEFQIPNPGVLMDYDQVNVVYTAPGGDEFTVFYVGGLAACDPVNGGWYYDVDPNAGTPSKILLCPQSCQFMQDHSGSIDIEIGCETITGPK